VLINDAHEEGFGWSGDQGGMGDTGISGRVFFASLVNPGIFVQSRVLWALETCSSLRCGDLRAAGVVISQTEGHFLCWCKGGDMVYELQRFGLDMQASTFIVKYGLWSRG